MKTTIEYKRSMALDIGVKRIGVALSDLMEIISQPHVTIEYGNQADAFRKIGEIIEEKEVHRVIAGLPLNKDGEFTPKTTEIEKFIVKLEKYLKLKIIRVDERWTSQEAEDLMRELGVQPSRNKADIDKFAAAIMLREYLENTEK